MPLNTEIKIEYVSPESLVPYEKNSRTHSPDQVDQICKSINQFGFTNPILISEKKEIIAGHGRLDAAKILKLEKVPVIVLAGLTDDQRRAYVIADNKIALNSGWDEDLLLEEILHLQDVDFDIDVLAFSEKELADMMPSLPDIEDGFSGSEGKEQYRSADTSGVIGPYRFPISRTAFLEWETDIQKKVGLDKNAVIAEIKRRLGF